MRPPPPSAGTPALASDSPLRSSRLNVHENAGSCPPVARLLPAETRLSGSDYVPTPCPPVPSHGRSGADDVPVGTPVGNCRRCRPFGPSPCLASYPERISSCLLSPSDPTRKPNHVGAGSGRTWRQPRSPARPPPAPSSPRLASAPRCHQPARRREAGGAPTAWQAVAGAVHRRQPRPLTPRLAGARRVARQAA